MTNTYIQKANENRDEHRAFQRDWSTEAVTGLICEVMEQQNVSRSELARRLGVTASAVTQILDQENNPTIHTLSDAFFELGKSLEFHCRPLSRVTDQSPAVFLGEAGETINWNGVTDIAFTIRNTPDAIKTIWATEQNVFNG